MAERLRALLHGIGRIVAALGRGLAWFFGGLARRLRRTWRVASVERAIRGQERRRTEVHENLGKMVYLLYKRNLVRNPDLLAECEKIVAIDARIDELIAQSDRIRTDRPTVAEPTPPVAATPAEMDYDTAEASAPPVTG